jgi:uncharacterized membrane protein YhhN
MIFAFITAWLAYKKAKETERNSPILWAFAGAGVFIGTQLLVTFGIGILVGLGIAFWNWSETLYDDLTIPITVFAVVLSFVASWLFLKYLDRVPQQISFTEPPPPPDFGGRDQ